MKIATWNLERGGRTRLARPAQEDTLRELAADVVALTEVPTEYVDAERMVSSPPERMAPRGRESWAAIVGSSVERVPYDIPYERMAVAARVGSGDGSFILYCAVLPWLSVASHAPDVVREGETSMAAFRRVLAEQVEDIVELRRRYERPVIWAGDFNQTVAGPLWGGSGERRTMLEGALRSLGLAAWNGSAAHAIAGMCAVDLICGPADQRIVAQGRIDPCRGDVVMSDHAGYWIDI